MSINQEIEFKTLLTAREFAAAMGFFKESGLPQSMFRQDNHYFETDKGEFKARRSALRVRRLEADGSHELTLKSKNELGHLEISQPISPSAFAAIKKEGILPSGEVKDALLKMGLPAAGLKSLAKFTTKRCEIPYQGGLICLDHTVFSHQEDFELEYEVADFQAGEISFRQLMEDLGLPGRPADSKIKRALCRQT